MCRRTCKTCNSTYDSTYKYNMDWESIRFWNKNPMQGSAKAHLDQFSASKNLSCTWDDILKICKGKWVLGYFADQFRNLVNKLPQYCASGKVEACSYHGSPEHNHKCLYSPDKSSIQESVLRNYIRKSRLNNTQSIKKKLMKLA